MIQKLNAQIQVILHKSSAATAILTESQRLKNEIIWHIGTRAVIRMIN